ncbi:uncharacterized protein MKK02DRAFT_31924 [Dioszegia hungarica]|uniref:Uncharacterized protein n=1 Tax=Dioszegia hungarica TaxID=4972 RepID=A0AA38LWM2_9TREE|nr:uncharacterized protein MKK02DRAFT_31924 [Dioszegia hungarica]KAI9638490.1 hypothetical protein MKK02DRAFT_31924 [Dioszegia hungarica]
MNSPPAPTCSTMIPSTGPSEQSVQSLSVQSRDTPASSEQSSYSREKRFFGAVGEPVSTSTSPSPVVAGDADSVQLECPPECLGCLNQALTRRIEDLSAQNLELSLRNTDMDLSLDQAQEQIRDLKEQADTQKRTLDSENRTVYDLYNGKKEEVISLEARLSQSQREVGDLLKELSAREAVLRAASYDSLESQEEISRLRVINEALRARVRRGALACPESYPEYHRHLMGQVAKFGRPHSNSSTPAYTTNIRGPTTPYPSGMAPVRPYDEWAQPHDASSGQADVTWGTPSMRSGVRFACEQSPLPAPAGQRVHTLARTDIQPRDASRS